MVARWGLRKRGWNGSNTLLYGRGATSHLSASVHGVESEIGFDLQNLVPRLKPRLRAKSPRHKGGLGSFCKISCGGDGKGCGGHSLALLKENMGTERRERLVGRVY